MADLYGEEIALATGRRTIPHGGFDRYEVFVPSNQRKRMIEAGMIPRIERVRPWRVFPEKLPERRRELVLAFRTGTISDLERHDCLEGALLVWSQWRGYLEEGRSPAVRDFLARHGIPLVVHHTSGHAAAVDLRRLAEMIQPKSLVPMHGLAPVAVPRDLSRRHDRRGRGVDGAVIQLDQARQVAALCSDHEQAN